MIPAYVRDAQTGSESAWAELYERHYRPVLRITTRLVGPEFADDVAQDVFTKLVAGKLKQFRGDAQFTSWLYRVAFTAALEHLRHARHRLKPESLDGLIEDFGEKFAFVSVPDGRQAQAGSRRDLKRAFARLAPGYRRVLLLCGVWGYTNQEAAEIMNVTVGCVKSQLHRAREVMREILQGGK